MVNKKLIIASVFSLLSVSLYAQPMGEAAQVAQEATEDKGSLSFLDELDVQAETVSNARKSADDYLIEKKWPEGLHSGTNRYVVVASATISLPPSDPRFQIARVNAYDMAMLNAKKDIAKTYGQDIQTSMRYLKTKPPSASAQRKQAEKDKELANLDPGFFEKVKTLVNKKIDDALAKEGVTYDSPRAESIIDNVVNSKSFSSSIDVMATQQVGALVTKKIFEQDGEIVIIAYYSPQAKELAAAINGKDVNIKVKPRGGDPLGLWVKKLKKSQLYSAMGVQFASDEDGNIVMLSYGQYKARSKSGDSKEDAYDDAELEADANIRRFAGETIFLNQNKAKFENTVEFEDGVSLSEVEDNSKKEIKAIGESLTISGITTLHRWDIVDIRSDSLICGVVRAWSIGTADAANIAREDMKDATINRGGRLAAPAKSANSSSKNASSSGASSYKNNNVDTRKYKIESIESEDF